MDEVHLLRKLLRILLVLKDDPPGAWDDEYEQETEEIERLCAAMNLSAFSTLQLLDRIQGSGYVVDTHPPFSSVTENPMTNLEFTPLGLAVAETPDEVVRKLQASPDARARALQAEMLRWLKDLESKDINAHGWGDFEQLYKRHLGGEFFSGREIAKQASVLYRRGLIDAIPIEEEAPGGIDPRLTDDGEDAVPTIDDLPDIYLDRPPPAGSPAAVHYNYGPILNGSSTGNQFGYLNDTVQQNQISRRPGDRG